MSTEDAMIISTLIAKAKTRMEVFAALQFHDKTRWAQCQAIIDSSYDVGLLVCGRKPGVGLDAKRLEDELRDKWEHIYGYDVEQAKREVLGVMREEMKMG